ncbi:MAG: PadR family transcriptional regulator [Ktedonobacteraceae bacterium]|nr:PadR family transcriptional regulator [Ktedonobacteraceae bacterium]
MALSHAILATLLDGPVSGYKLSRRFNAAIGYFWQATHQQIYRELATLEERGYVERVPSAASSTEKCYALTPEGRDALRTWITQPSEPGVLREDLLLKVRAGALVTLETLLAELRRRRAVHAERLAVYRDLQQRYFPDPQHLSREQRFLYLPLLRGLMFEADNIAWCDTALDLLQQDSQ